MNNKTYFLRGISLLWLCLLGAGNLAADAAQKNIDPDYLSNYLGKILVISGLIFAFAVVLYIFRIFNLMIHMEERRLLKEQGIVLEPEPLKEKGPSMWQRLYDWSTQAVPVEREADVMLDHNYDGIRELDNSLPPWWVAMFYITIVIGVGYFAYYHVLDKGPLSGEEYAIEMAIAEKQQRLRLAKQANAVNENSVTVLTSESALAAGSRIFINNCAACHGQKGEGGVGPNMTDDYWVHGGSIKDIFKTIKYGVPEKGMISWKSQLAPSSMQEVASFITTLRGTNPPNGQAAEGELYDYTQTEEAPEETTDETSL